MPRAERASRAANRSPPSSDQRERPSERWRATRRGDSPPLAARQGRRRGRSHLQTWDRLHFSAGDVQRPRRFGIGIEVGVGRRVHKGHAGYRGLETVVAGRAGQGRRGFHGSVRGSVHGAGAAAAAAFKTAGARPVAAALAGAGGAGFHRDGDARVGNALDRSRAAAAGGVRFGGAPGEMLEIGAAGGAMILVQRHGASLPQRVWVAGSAPINAGVRP